MIKIYTDGSCIGNPGKGGWAVIIFMNNEKKILKGSKDITTNNQMELTATIKALEYISTKDKIQIYTDSKYVKQGITEWITKWKINGWKTSKKEEVKNKDLWLELDNLASKNSIEWVWVKAHSDNDLNNEVDLLARKEAGLY